MLEQYQDIWIKGNLIKKGVRECEDRYQILKKFCSQFKRQFTVLDIGANLGYFSLRLMEDFDCVSVMVESPKFYASKLEKILTENECDRGILLKKHLDIPTMKKISEVEHFDVVLAMSVIHHIPGDLKEVYEAMKNLGDHLLIEVPVEGKACNPRGVKSIDFIEGDLLGTGKSHLEKTTRPIYHSHKKKITIESPYLRYNWNFTLPIINSNFDKKTITYRSRKEHRDWIAGINFWTYLELNGVYPKKEEIINTIKGYDFKDHADLRPWNIILSGKTINPIDESKNRTKKYDTETSKKEMIDYLEGRISKMKDMVLK